MRPLQTSAVYNTIANPCHRASGEHLISGTEVPELESGWVDYCGDISIIAETNPPICAFGNSISEPLLLEHGELSVKRKNRGLGVGIVYAMP